MSGERLFRILGLVDDDLIEEADTASSAAASKRRVLPWCALGGAACLLLLCGLGVYLRAGTGLSGGAEGVAPGSNAAGGAGHDASAVFMSYAGPVFPLTTAAPYAGLTAERKIVWDFTAGSYADGEPRQWGSQVTDSYILKNSTEEDITVTALYPFAGNFDSLSKIHPAVTVNGATVQPELFAGPFSGGLQDMEGHRDPADGEAWNLYDLNSWEDYRALLQDGNYQSQALSEYPTLNIPVTVYEFTDFAAPHETYQAATQAVSFTINEDTSQILSYGFNGYDRDTETGFRRYSYFVPNGVTREVETKVLIVLGEDIGDYTLQGYQDGGCEDGEEISGVSCTVTRRETTLDEVLDFLCREYHSLYNRDRAADQKSSFNAVPFALYRGAVGEFLLQYTTLSGTPKQRYSDGRLDEILQEALFLQRVLYLRFPVTISAKSSIAVNCSFWKNPSYDFYCSGSENAGLQGYDLMTRLGTSLVFTRQTAALENTEGIEIVRQNLGFDLENGITSAELDPEQDHYYLEIRVKE